MSKMASSMDEKLKDILAKVLLIDESKISDGMSRKSVKEWDSMAHLMLVSEIESAFEVTMDDDDIMEIQTVGDIKKTLKKVGITT
ncbi:acyl carrier protein [archaeon]|nr:acyl carrier protein [archaeon]TET28400.1 MAG: acyl carrier protein [Candidatus Bathyarchaeum sp.]